MQLAFQGYDIIISSTTQAEDFTACEGISTRDKTGKAGHRTSNDERVESHMTSTHVYVMHVYIVQYCCLKLVFIISEKLHLALNELSFVNLQYVKRMKKCIYYTTVMYGLY